MSGEGAEIDKPLSEATCAVTVTGQLRGTAWLLDNLYLITAAHVLGKNDPVKTVELTFVDDPIRQVADRIAWKYKPEEGIDCCVLKLKEPALTRNGLRISLSRSNRGGFRLYGFGRRS